MTETYRTARRMNDWIRMKLYSTAHSYNTTHLKNNYVESQRFAYVDKASITISS